MDGFSFHYSVEETPSFSFTDAFEFYGDEYQSNGQSDQRGFHSDGLFYGLPERTRSCFLQDGIQDLYPWQKEVLEDARLLQGSNYLFCCSTNAGKTLPAEVLMLRTVWLRSKKVIMVLPYVSLVTEKLSKLKKRFKECKELDIRIEGYYGGHGVIPVPERVNICVCTIEKSNIVINSLIEENKLNEYGLIVVDELHMLSETGRGAILESLLSKVIYLNKGIQIVGMSATLPNNQDISLWLKSSVYSLEWRPVLLHEYLCINNTILDKNGNLIRNLYNCKLDDVIGELIYEVISIGKSVLIFCPSKDDCQQRAKKISLLFNQHFSDLLLVKQEERQILLRKLENINEKLDPILKYSILYGIIYHNSSLATEERQLIEEAYKQRIVNIVFATSTLAAGVNMPAQRVLLIGLKMGIEKHSVKQYKQMIGRAGRAGLDDLGESFLLIEQREKKEALKLMNGTLEPLQSSLKSGIKRLLIDCIAGKWATDKNNCIEFLKSTLFSAQSTNEEFSIIVEESIQYLLKKGFISINEENKFVSSKLGEACFRSSFTVEEAFQIKQDFLQHSKIDIFSDLNLMYFLTPVFNLPSPDWQYFSEKLWNRLEPSYKEIAKLFSIEEGYIVTLATKQYSTSKMTKSNSNGTIEDSLDKKTIASRFFWALCLTDIINEVPIYQLEQKYRISRGNIQSFIQSAEMWCSSIVNFCKNLDFWQPASLLDTFCKRINFGGVKAELIPLTEVKGIKKSRARALWNYGFRTVRAIAQATPEEIAKALGNSVPPNKAPLPVARKLINNANDLLKLKAEELRETAAKMLSDMNNPL